MEGGHRIFRCKQTDPPGKDQSWMNWQKCDQLRKENGGVGELEACTGVIELSFENGIASQPWISPKTISADVVWFHRCQLENQTSRPN